LRLTSLKDALIADPAHQFFWPVSLQNHGIGIFTETRDIIGIANSEVLLIGIVRLSGDLSRTDAGRRKRVMEGIPAGRDPEREMNSS
jgi:hypothetical protein